MYKRGWTQLGHPLLAFQHQEGVAANKRIAPQILWVHTTIEEEAEGALLKKLKGFSSTQWGGNLSNKGIALHFFWPSLVDVMHCVKHFL